MSMIRPQSSPSTCSSAAWVARAGELARFALRRLVNRCDCRGGYRPGSEWGKPYTRKDGTQGKLGQQTTRTGEVTLGVLARHFRGERREDIVGLHTTSTANTSRWFFLDIDWHGAGSTAPAVNWRAALGLYGDRRGHTVLSSTAKVW